MKAVFAGRFDPFTAGHAEIVLRARNIFDEIIVAVASDAERAVAPVGMRCEIAVASLNNVTGVSVKPFSGLLTDFMAREGYRFMIRGVRDYTDFLYEQNLSAAYKNQNAEMEQVYFITDHKHGHISGTIVRELARLNGNLDGYVAKDAVATVKSVYGKSN